MEVMNTRLEKWIKWLEVIHGDVGWLLINRNIFREVQGIVNNNKKLYKPNIFYQYLGDTYTTFAAIGIRRQVKIDKQSISLVRLLHEIAGSPSTISREYYKKLYEGSVVAELADVDFDRLSGKGKDHICPDMLWKDIENLKLKARKIEDFADKRVAHYDKRSPRGVPNFSEVDDCIDTLDGLCVKYHLIFHAVSMDTLMPVFQFYWKDIFEIPWLKSGVD
jgi:hypothetical protein